LLPQPELEEGGLTGLISEFAQSPERLQAMAAEARRFAAPQATGLVADLCMEAARG
jgi:UDP-N-acetylglucosamine:LPS N-acetylglucosamine transferase